MRLSTREDIEAPIEAVFAKLSDFDGFERAALRRGADVVRLDELAAPGAGMSWKVGFEFRGRARNAEIKLVGFDAPNSMNFNMRAAGLEADLLVELLAMSRGRTRMQVVLDASPHSIPARLMLQSLKLAKANVTKRFRRRVGEFAADIEERCRLA